MGGGLMQLVAYGAQDIYLTGNPQITFFKVVYRRHTNFAMESIQQTFNGSADFGNKVTATISRNGDLVHSMWVQATVPAVVVVPRSKGNSNVLMKVRKKETAITISTFLKIGDIPAYGNLYKCFSSFII